MKIKRVDFPTIFILFMSLNLQILLSHAKSKNHHKEKHRNSGRYAVQPEITEEYQTEDNSLPKQVVVEKESVPVQKDLEQSEQILPMSTQSPKIPPKAKVAKKYPKGPGVSEKLNTFYSSLGNLLAITMTEDNKVGPEEGLEGHSDVLDAMFYLLKTRCYVVNARFAHHLKNLNQVLLNLVVDQVTAPTVPNNNNSSGYSGTETDSPNPKVSSTPAPSEAGDEDYQIEGSKKRRRRNASWDSVGASISKCLKITREIIYNLDGKGVPTSWYHWSTPQTIVAIAPPRDTVLEKVLHINPIIEALWQVFLFAATACDDELRKEPNSVDRFVNTFIESFGPVFKSYWLDDKNYTFFYEDMLKKVNYKREIQKIKACNYAYQTRNPDIIVPRRPFW